jgi:ABC-type multidrug transport system ATPase subunit
VPPLLAASAVRIDVAGSPALDGLTLSTTGDRLLVMAAPRALFEVAAGLRGVARGELLVEGVAPPEAVRRGLVACAPRDPPMPPAWTVHQYVTWSARLVGHARATARQLADDAVARLALGSMAAARLGGTTAGTRRGAVLAAAVATAAPGLLLEDPLLGLPDEVARPFARVVARLLAERRAVVFAGRLPLDSPLALWADEAVVIDGSEVVAQGQPAEIASAERTLALRVHGDVQAFARRVEAAGGVAVVQGGAPTAARVRVDLGPLAARDLLRIAAEADAVVIELRPLAGAFA